MCVCVCVCSTPKQYNPATDFTFPGKKRKREQADDKEEEEDGHKKNVKREKTVSSVDTEKTDLMAEMEDTGVLKKEKKKKKKVKQESN